MNLCKKKQPVIPSSQSGFTIIESLLAILVVSLLMTAISPVIVLSVATRVQAKRVEAGTQAAKTYIDGVRSGVIDPPNSIVTINGPTSVTTNGSTSTTPATSRLVFAQVAAPTTSLPTCTTPTKGYCNDPTVAASSSNVSLYCVDLDGGGCSSSSNRDLIVQAFRSVTTAQINPNQGYLLAVRVYRADGFTTVGGNLQTMGSNSTKQATYSGSMGNKKVPLVEMTTEIPPQRTNDQTGYKNYCDRLGGCTP